MRQDFEAILNNYGVECAEVEKVLYAAREMLELAAQEIAEKEPYASTSISNLENAAREVYDLTDLL